MDDFEALRTWWLSLHQALRDLEPPRSVLIPDDGPPDDVVDRQSEPTMVGHKRMTRPLTF